MMISGFLEMPVTVPCGCSSANVRKWSGTGAMDRYWPKTQREAEIFRDHWPKPWGKTAEAAKGGGVFLRLLKLAGENVLNILLIFRIGAQDICQQSSLPKPSPDAGRYIHWL